MAKIAGKNRGKLSLTNCGFVLYWKVPKSAYLKAGFRNLAGFFIGKNGMKGGRIMNTEKLRKVVPTFLKKGGDGIVVEQEKTEIRGG